jgi:Mg-chelatase subunit ChlD
VNELRTKGLDIVFVIDGTASMGDVIAEVRRDLASLVDTIQSTVPVARIGFVVYRDRADDVPIEIVPLTYSRAKLAAFLGQVRAEGGGDWPESLNLGLQAAIERMPWRPGAKRLLVFIASSPPHDDERAQTIELARRLHDEGGAVSAVDLSAAMHEAFERKMARWLHGEELQSTTPLPDFYREVQATFAEIVRAGGGEMIQFREDKALVKHLLILTFGTRWQKEVEALASVKRPVDDAMAVP